MRWCLLLIIITLSGCQPSHRIEPVTVVIGSWYGFYPLFYAQSLELDKRHNIRLKIVEPTNVSNFRRSYLRSQVEFAATSMLEYTNAVVLSRQTLKPTIITDYSNGGDVIVTSKTIESIADLRDKRISVRSKGIGGYILSIIFENSEAGQFYTQIKIPETQCSDAFIEGEIDACLTYPPLSTQMLASNPKLHVIYDSSQYPRQIFDMIWAKQDVPKTTLDNMRSIWFEVIERINKAPEDYYQYGSNIANVTPESVKVAMAGIHLIDQAEHATLWESNEQLAASLVTACKVASRNQCLTFEHAFKWAEQ